MDDLFFSNQTEKKFLDKLKECLSSCDKFFFSVSFIKYAGLKLIQKELEEALRRGVEGYLITSTYQNFTDIPSLKYFLELQSKYQNFHCHLDYECFGESGFHSKGYLFQKGKEESLLVGSSNITRFALLYNVEWNLFLSDSFYINAFKEAKKEFMSLYGKTLNLDPSLIERYKESMAYSLVKWDMDYSFSEPNSPKPNSMQRKALKELMRNRDLGVNKSLVIAATGSGKTYLAAFDAKNFGAKRLLFVVHRETILNDAMKTFSNVFKASRSYGLYTGSLQEMNADFLFASSSMLSRHLKEFDPNEFDYIVFDEVHHIVANCGQKIFQYFKPEFLLGLTATPERLDQKDVFGIFDNNVSFEMRLKDALINDLVVPFHYYGIRDEFADYSSENKSIIAKEISKGENIDFIARQIDKYKKKNEKLKAIAFCSSIQHAQSMAERFNDYGFPAVSLTGINDTGARIKAFNSLQDDESSLQIICCVDVLNEGVDIPRINMVLFLRPTESPTIFLQQLGRGLRKAESKPYCTVLDFIGNNYKRSTQIAFALGTLTNSPFVDQYTLKQMVNSNFQSLGIPNLSIFFDDLSKKEIIAYLDKTNFYSLDILKSDYSNFKKYLKTDSYPKQLDYLNSEISPDLIKFLKVKMNGKKNFSYYEFLRKVGEETLPLLKEEEVSFLNKLSDFLPLVRVDEFLIVKNLLLGTFVDLNSLIGFNPKVNEKTLSHAFSLLNRLGIIADNKLNIQNISGDLKDFLLDTLNYGLSRYEEEFGDYLGQFKLLGNYYKEQVMMILLQDNLQYMKGTKFFDDSNETYIFVNLKKDGDSLERLNYKDKFLDNKTFQWESENNVTVNNAYGKKIINTKTVHLFVRKMDMDHGVNVPFAYLGEGSFKNIKESSNAGTPTLLAEIDLKHEIGKDNYDDFDIIQ